MKTADKQKIKDWQKMKKGVSDVKFLMLGE